MNHHWSDCLCPATSDQTRVGKVRTWLHVETEFREERGNPELLLLFILSPAQRKERFLYKPIRAQTHLTSHVILHNHSLLSNNSDSDYCVTRPLFSIQSNTVFLLLNVCFEWHSGSSQFRVIGSLTSWWVKRGDFAMLSENCFVCLSGPITRVWGRDYLSDWTMTEGECLGNTRKWHTYRQKRSCTVRTPDWCSERVKLCHELHTSDYWYSLHAGYSVKQDAIEPSSIHENQENNLSWKNEWICQQMHEERKEKRMPIHSKAQTHMQSTHTTIMTSLTLEDHGCKQLA